MKLIPSWFCVEWGVQKASYECVNGRVHVGLSAEMKVRMMGYINEAGLWVEWRMSGHNEDTVSYVLNALWRLV